MHKGSEINAEAARVNCFCHLAFCLRIRGGGALNIRHRNYYCHKRDEKNFYFLIFILHHRNKHARHRQRQGHVYCIPEYSQLPIGPLQGCQWEVLKKHGTTFCGNPVCV